MSQGLNKICPPGPYQQGPTEWVTRGRGPYPKLQNQGLQLTWGSSWRKESSVWAALSSTIHLTRWHCKSNYTTQHDRILTIWQYRSIVQFRKRNYGLPTVTAWKHTCHLWDALTFCLRAWRAWPSQHGVPANYRPCWCPRPVIAPVSRPGFTRAAWMLALTKYVTMNDLTCLPRY